MIYPFLFPLLISQHNGMRSVMLNP